MYLKLLALNLIKTANCSCMVSQPLWPYLTYIMSYSPLSDPWCLNLCGPIWLASCLHSPLSAPWCLNLQWPCLTCVLFQLSFVCSVMSQPMWPYLTCIMSQLPFVCSITPHNENNCLELIFYITSVILFGDTSTVAYMFHQLYKIYYLPLDLFHC